MITDRANIWFCLNWWLVHSWQFYFVIIPKCRHFYLAQNLLKTSFWLEQVCDTLRQVTDKTATKSLKLVANLLDLPMTNYFSWRFTCFGQVSEIFFC